MMTKSSSLILEHVSKMSKFICAFLFATALMVTVNVNHAAANTEQLHIAVLDMGYVLRNSKALQSADKQLQGLETRLRADREKSNNTLRDEEQKLQQQRVLLSPDAFSKKRDEFSVRVRKNREDMQNRGRQLALTRASAAAEVEKALEPIVSAIANKVGANMIVDRRQTIFNAKTLDITEKVSAELNKKLPTIKVTLVELPKK